jgi:N-acetylglucosamine kinase-like BadF-type ATPase
VTQPPVSQPLPAVLAIDGGNSKTEAVLVAADGTLLAQVRGAASNPQTCGGLDAAFAVLSGLVAQAAAQAGLAGGPGGDGGPVAGHCSACLAGADLPEEELQLTELVAARGWSRSAEVVNDTFAVLRAGLDDGPGQRWGVGVTCGAGINCVGVAPDGRVTRFLSLGQDSGDWGGGGDLARDALWHAARAEDGRGPATLLATAVPAHFGLARVRDVTIGRHHGKISGADMHGLVPVLFAVAGQGDEVAVRLLTAQADEIVTMASVAARRLDLASTDLPVVLGGSIVTARDPLLTARLTERLAAELPAATMRIVDVPPVAGAALLGLDAAGANEAAAARLRASYPGAGQAAGHLLALGLARGQGYQRPWCTRSSRLRRRMAEEDPPASAAGSG